MGGEDVLDHVRALVVVPHGQLFFRRFIVGDEAPCLEADAGMAAEHEGFLDYVVGLGIGGIDVAEIRVAAPGQIVAQFVVDHGRTGGESRFRIGGNGQDVPVYVHQGGGVFGAGAAVRNDGDDGLPLPAGRVQRQRVLWRRFKTFEVGEDADPGRADFRHVPAGHDREDAGHGLGRLDIDRFHAGMGIGRAHESRVHHPFHLDIVDEGASALCEAGRIGAGDGAPDIGIRPVENPAAGILRDHVGHDDPPLARAISTASTIAW